MPYDYDLEKFKVKAHDESIKLANSAGSRLQLLIEEQLVAAYIAGYKQCEQDYHDHYGL